MGMRLEDREKGLTKSQLLHKQLDRLQEHFGEPPELTLGEQHKRDQKLGHVESAVGEPPRTIVDYDPRCFACSDQPQRIIRAFKMACLTYKPGKVPYMGETLSRDAVLHVQDQVLSMMAVSNREAELLLRQVSQALKQQHHASPSEMSNAARGDPEITSAERQHVRGYTAELTANDHEVLRVMAQRDPFAAVDGREGSPMGSSKLADTCAHDESARIENVRAMAVMDGDKIDIRHKSPT